MPPTARRLVPALIVLGLLASSQAAPQHGAHSQAAPRALYLPRVARDAVQHWQWIGPEGGEIAVTAGDLARVRLVVPPGAVAVPTRFGVQAGHHGPVLGPRAVGLPVLFSPAGRRFAKDLTLTLPFDPALLPPGSTAADLAVVNDQPATGAPARLQPDQTGEATVTVAVDVLSTFHVHAPLVAPECPPAAPPEGCVALAPPSGTPDLVVDGCYTVSSNAAPYAFRYIHVVDGGTLFFVDDGGAIDFRVSSLLVEQGGALQAGAWCRPFGRQGGRLTIGLWGSDPTQQGMQPPTTPGIQCLGPNRDGRCYPAGTDDGRHYCTGSDPANPCGGTTADANGANALFEPYGDAPYDDNPFGYKVLAVSYGGRLALYGQHGVRPADLVTGTPRLASCPVPAPAEQRDPQAWADLTGGGQARLAAPAAAGATTITLDRAVDWRAGDEIVVGTTDWYVSHTEVATVSANDGAGTLTLAVPLAYPHEGPMYAVPPALAAQADNPNTAVDLRPAVGLLTRSITVKSLGDGPDEAFPEPGACGIDSQDPPAGCYFGGHTMVRQGFGRFEVQGVAFEQLGQGGRMGHYPVHFHMAKSTDYTQAFLKDSTIRDSLNRFVTVHATHDVLLARNLGYLSVGHGYYLEDGSEINNLLCHNLALSLRPALTQYLASQPPDSPTARLVPPILPRLSGLSQVSGSDAFMPVAYWTMNTWNELVGNKAVGVGGYGACFWLLGSGVSGMSSSLAWTTGGSSPEGYANYNQAGTRQAPLKLFRGNSCGTAAYALQTSLLTNPQTPDDAGYGAVPNPYTLGDDMLPRVSGNYQPILIGGAQNCTQGLPVGASWVGNVQSCSGAVIDRFTTAFNWGQVGFGAIWLRPWWYLFLNGAVTDQLAGGLGFVSGGSWSQVPPGYYTLTQDSVFVGSTQAGGSPWAAATGPAFAAPPGAPPGFIAPDCGQSGNACVLPAEGTGLFKGGFNPKRLISIYDGPFYADGNVFTNVAPIDCDPTSWASCGIYLATTQPKVNGQMRVMNAAIGWKQTNGFYYPPAFALRRSAFDDSSLRHNVLDQYSDYIQGSAVTPNPGAPATFSPLTNGQVVTPIDFSTILLDLDGTLTGVTPATGGTQTASLSVNHFFDAPSQMPECLSFGVQTSPSEMVTTVAAILRHNANGNWVVNDQAWNAGGVFPAVPIYRQLTLPGDAPGGLDPCAGPNLCAGRSWGCGRGAFMMGAQTGQAPYLTANGGVYYIDAYPQAASCVSEGGVHVPGFSAGNTYALYQLFPRADTRISYQVYVGEAFDPATDGAFIRTDPHVFDTSDGGTGNSLVVTPTSLPGASATVSNGVLTVVLDNALIAEDFAFAARDPNQACMPRDLCQPDGNGACTVADNWAGGDLADDIEAACRYWATATGGSAAATDGLSLADCPDGGCLGYMFTLPAGYTPLPYDQAGLPLATCFPDDGTWNLPLTRVDGACEPPPAPSGFCP